ncbi:NACHT and TPR domain protein [Patellaria atrata CBS 101060]|uniref:NACHT and TPR domain protein n=1 Tax=Patellaria atrata CBS 101060 TaxID=1346257 RepID=A0A9P4VRB7_9PEZI|nr:NACHT and TPR domain protein [Patellaria atrata CBS 101060]
MGGLEDQFAVIWNAALARYADTTGQRVSDSSFPKPTATEDLMDLIRRQNNSFVSFREHHGNVFSALDAALHPLEVLSKVSEGGAVQVLPQTCVLFGAVSVMIYAARGVTAAYDAIQELFETLRHFTVRLKIYNQEELSQDMMVKLAEVLATLLEVFALSTKLMQQGRVKKFVKNLFTGYDEAIGGAMKKLARITETEESLVAAESFINLKRTGRDVEKLTYTTSATASAVNETAFMIREMSLDVTGVRQELSRLTSVTGGSGTGVGADDFLGSIKAILQPSVHPQDFYDDISKNRVLGTGNWVQREPSFQAWSEKQSPIIYVSGIPGSGKSFLSSSIISYLREQHPQRVNDSSHVSIAYFFFKDSSPETRSVHQALRDISFQICQNDPLYAKYVGKQITTASDIQTIRSAWRKLFVDYFTKSKENDSSAFILLDGMDEAYNDERHTFLDLLGEVKTEQNASRIKLAMVGRPQVLGDIEDGLEQSVPTIEITSAKNSEDIVSYIQISIRKSRVLRRTSKTLQEEIVSKLTDGANGMFLWVDLMLRELNRATRESTIREKLNRAPRDLTNMLRHVLKGFSESLNDEEPDDLNTLLAYVACASRPLKLIELDAILKVRSQTGDGMIYLEGNLRKQYASFFTVTREDGLSTGDLQNQASRDHDDGNETDHDEHDGGMDDLDTETDFDSNKSTTEVTFCHASIGEFFRDPDQGKISADGANCPEIGVNIHEARVDALKICFDVFCNDSAKYSSLKDFAEDHLISILEYMKPENVGMEDKALIGTYLVRILTSGADAERFIASRSTSFYQQSTIDLILSWLKDGDVLSSLTAEDLDWVNSCHNNPTSIFSYAAGVLAMQWLKKKNWVPEICFQIIHKINSLGSKSVAQQISVEVVVNTAKSFNFEEDATWNRRLAIVLSDYKFYDSAKEHFEQALKLDPSDSLILSGIGSMYAAQGSYDKALQAQLKSEAILEQVIQDQKAIGNDTSQTVKRLATVQQALAEQYKQIGDEENCLHYAKVSFGNDGDIYDMADLAVRTLFKAKKYEEIMDFLKSLEYQIPGEDYSRLTGLLWFRKFHNSDFAPVVGDAAGRTASVAYLIHAYFIAVAAARKNLLSTTEVALELCAAQLFHMYAFEEAKAVRIWRKVYNTVPLTTNAETEMAWLRSQAALQLALLYYTKACESKLGSSECQENVEKLEQLAKYKAKAIDTFPSLISVSGPSVVLGLWYFRANRIPEAMECFKPHIKESIQILSDDDLNNDDSGFYQLSQVLMAAGDDTKAIAAFHCQRPTQEFLEDEAGVAKDDDDSYAAYTCDGPCRRQFLVADDSYVCRVCYDTSFCPNCLDLLRSSSIPYNVCNRAHDMLYIPRIKKKINRGEVLVDDNIVSLEEYLKTIKLEWGL